MTNQIPKPNNVSLKWSLINLAATVIFTYAIQFLNLDPNSPVKYLNYLPFILFLVLAQKEYKETLGGYITFNQAFSAGLKYSLFSALFLAIFMYLYLAILSPDVFEKSLVASQTKMAENGMSTEQIDKAMDIAKKYGPIFGSFFAGIFYIIFGVIISLIGAAIFKKERSPYDAHNDTEIQPPVEPTV
jgi:hypothetical protein